MTRGRKVTAEGAQISGRGSLYGLYIGAGRRFVDTDAGDREIKLPAWNRNKCSPTGRRAFRIQR